MNKILKELIGANVGQIELIAGKAIANAAEQAIDDYIAQLKSDNPFNKYVDPEFVRVIKAVIHGECPASDNDQSKIANAQIEKQFNIAAGTAPEQTGKRGPA